MKRLLLLFAVCVLGTGLVCAEQITGTVVNASDGEPVVGASVMVVGSSTGTITDVDGVFVLNVSSDSQLTISFVGMA